MRRKMWTDERLSDRFDNLDRGLERVDRDVRDFRTLMIQLWGSTIIGSIGVIATLVVTR